MTGALLASTDMLTLLVTLLAAQTLVPGLTQNKLASQLKGKSLSIDMGDGCEVDLLANGKMSAPNDCLPDLVRDDNQLVATWSVSNGNLSFEASFIAQCRFPSCKREHATSNTELNAVFASGEYLSFLNRGSLTTMRCTPKCTKAGDFVGVKPGAKNRALYDKVTAALPAVAATFFAAPAATSPRTISEVWYSTSDDSAAHKALAVALAAKLRPLLGELEPKAWTFEAMGYNVLLVVGETAGGEAAATTGPGAAGRRVMLMDGLCTEKGEAKCENPAIAAWSEKLKQAGHTVVGVKKSKAARTGPEVWFTAGHEGDGKALADQLFTGQALSPKLWEWGGEFDVLLVVIKAP